MAMHCYHCSHEQFSPSHLLNLAQAAEAAGFNGIHSSDHFHPWSERQGHSGFSFSWIAAALQATKIPFSMVCAPGQRIHPAIAAQAMATLSEMYPGRINFELGSGEALNESITGEAWPGKNSRNERLLECVTVIRKLLDGKEVDHDGLIHVRKAKLYSLPEVKPLLLCAAITSETAAWAGPWADGLLTTADRDPKQTRDKIDRFVRNGGAGKPVYVQYAFSYARSRQSAVDGAYDQWRSAIVSPGKKASFSSVSDFDEAGENVSVSDVLEQVEIFTSIDSLKNKLGEYELPGVERIILHNVNKAHEDFISDWGNN